MLQLSITLLDFVRNILLKAQFIAKARDLVCDTGSFFACLRSHQLRHYHFEPHEVKW